MVTGVCSLGPKWSAQCATSTGCREHPYWAGSAAERFCWLDMDSPNPSSGLEVTLIFGPTIGNSGELSAFEGRVKLEIDTGGCLEA